MQMAATAYLTENDDWNAVQLILTGFTGTLKFWWENFLTEKERFYVSKSLNEKIQKSFPNWFQEWWLFMGATPNILCPEISKSFEYFKTNCESFFPSRNSYSLFFCAQFRIPWILCWNFCSHQSQPSPFPKYLAREFKIKWWAAFKINQAQTIDSVKEWIEAQKPKPSKSTKSKSKVPV